ncbi:hypothetical protein HZA73_06710 [candidate division TA06 bacterium]|nr:hypothetical protein [candidate division TA06 bacterium]
MRVTADNAWERCIVIYDEQNFGICTAEGFRLEKLETADGKKMKVNYTSGRNSKAIIKVPVALLGNPEKVRFVIVSTMPGAASYKISTACDVLPGGKKSIDSQLLTAYNEYTMPLAPGAVRSTTTTEGYLYDNDGNLMADLDGEKNITKRYVYGPSTGLRAGLGGKHLAMQINNTGYGPYSNACDDTANISIGGDSSPLTFNFTTDKQQGAFALQVNVGNPSGVGCNAGNFGLYNQGIEVESANYGYVHIWVKPLTAGSWMTFHVWDIKYGDWKTLKGDKDGDMYYEADQDMAVGQWNELWLKLDNNNREWTGTTVRSFSMHASNNASFIIDGVYTCSRDWKTFYYSCDYLNSPRVMTDASGAVVWRQDYLAFGADYGTAATGNSHKFTGHIQDGATGQYYAKARYFTTQLGRWSQPEPLLQGVPDENYLEYPQMLNPYVYSLNNPLKYIDPDGNQVFDKVEDLQKAGEAAVNNPALVRNEKTGDTYCNTAVQQIAKVGGVEDYAGNANVIANKLSDPKFATEVSDATAADYANKGAVVIAAAPEKTGRGHVAVVAPTKELQYSGTFKKSVPLIFNVGAKNKLVKVSEGFRSKNQPKYYIRNVDKKKVDERKDQ